MSGVWLEADYGRDVDGAWEVKSRRLFVTVADGTVYVSRSDNLSSPTLIEVPLRDLLRALADAA